MTEFLALNDCEFVVFNENAAEVKSVKSGEILKMEIVGHPKRIVNRNVVEDKSFIQVQFENGQFSLFNTKNVKLIENVEKNRKT